MTLVSKNGISCLTLVVLSVWASLVQAQTQEARRTDPHSPAASDGSALPAPKAHEDATFEAGFRGFGPTFERSDVPFEETGAAIDGAEKVEEFVEDPWEMSDFSGPHVLWGGSITGEDNRTRVHPTTTYPARAVVLITYDGGRCSGWLYGKNIVATAGHCVHSGGSGGNWRTNVRVYPGRDGSFTPYGSCEAKRLFSVQGWISQADEQYDYGAIKLNCTVGETTGWFGYHWQRGSLTGFSTILPGYPGDKAFTQWQSIGQVKVTQALQIFYTNDAIAGQSGGPVYNIRSFCGGPCAMAIHAYGFHGSPPHSLYNHGTRITQEVFDNLSAWKRAP